MKISKLFHWLYAFLMLLPALFLIPTALYFGFNDTASISGTHTEVIDEYYPTDSSVTGLDDLQGGYAYTIQFTYLGDSFINDSLFVPCDYVSIVQGTLYGNVDNSSIPCAFSYDTNLIDVFDGEKHYEIRSDQSQVVILNFVFTADTSRQSDLYYTASLVIDLDIHVLPCATPILKGTTTISVPNNVTYEFNDNLDSIFELPVFRWATNNFLVEPIGYLGALFGIQSGSLIIDFFSYWLSISIIYLCFDVIMYVPLLVHRWIDKARIE